MRRIKKIKLSAYTPREINDSLIPFAFGLEVERVLMYIFLLLSSQMALMILYLIIFDQLNFMSLGLCFFMLVIGYLCYQRIQAIRKIISTRKQIYIYGTPIHATVVDHSRKFVYYKSDRDYILHLRTIDAEEPIKLVSKEKWMTTAYPKGSEVIGLQYNNHQLFGPEVNRLFTI